MASVSLQDLRRRLYGKAEAEKTKRFGGLYVHVAKLETLRAAYESAKTRNSAPGIDGVTFAAIEAGGVEGWLAQRRDELVTRTYRSLRNRRVEIPMRGGKVRVLGIPAIRDRVVQGVLKLIMEPIFEADCGDGSYGYRPQRTALLGKLTELFRRYDSQLVERVITEINPILRGWVHYFRIGHSGRSFAYVMNWVEKKVRRPHHGGGYDKRIRQ
jgi:hypothetical protein